MSAAKEKIPIGARLFLHYWLGMQIQPVILAGGEGTRLAPLSTPARPKPFLPFRAGQSLLTLTCARLADIGDVLPPLLIGHRAQRFALLNHARAAGIAPGAILLEPETKNTALAIASATAYLQQADAMLLFLPADHAINDVTQWQQDVLALAQACFASRTLGILTHTAERFSPEFGYVLADISRQWVQQFIEKPTAIEGGLTQYGVNLGQVAGRASVLSEAIRTHAPDIWQCASRAVQKGHASYEFFELQAEAYAKATPVSFDVAVLEKNKPLHTRRTDCGWSDVGSIAAWEVHTGQPLAASLPAHARTDRPWGYYELIEATADYVLKRLVVYPGGRLSLQRHQRRSEHWRVCEGLADILCGNNHHRLSAGQEITIGQGTWHRLSNKMSVPLVIMETQQGAPDETDIERADDDYGRS